MQNQVKVFVRQWEALGQISALCRWSAIVSAAIALAMAIVVIVLANRDPLVVMEKCGSKAFYQAKRKTIVAKPQDIKKFARNFVATVYGEGEPKAIVTGLSCVATKGFLDKLRKQMGRQKIIQYVGQSKVILQEGKTLVSFDRIVRIKDTPIVARQTVELKIARDVQTACNPLGLYVNGMITGDVQ